jgi:hypothetical protein
MYKHINSASRVHTLLTKTLQQGDKPLFAILAEVFQVKGANDPETGVLVLSRLIWFYEELQLLETQVQELKIGAHLYNHAFARVRMVISPLHLSSGWLGMRGNLTADVLLAFGFLNELLPDEESLIPDEELTAIAGDIQDLYERVQKGELPTPLRKLVLHHLDLIAQAIAKYPISGAKALREAGHAALGEIIETQGSGVAAPTSSDELSRLDSIWKRVNSAADTALKLEKVGQLTHKAWDALSNWIQ